MMYRSNHDADPHRPAFATKAVTAGPCLDERRSDRIFGAKGVCDEVGGMTVQGCGLHGQQRMKGVQTGHRPCLPSG